MKKLFQLIFIPILTLLVTTPTQAIQTSSYQSSQVEIRSRGASASILMGQTAPVAQFRIYNQGDKALALEYLTFKNYGNADLTESFGDWKISLNGETVATWNWVERKNIYFLLPEPVLIGRGDSVNLDISAQLIWSRTNRDVQLGLQRAEDIDLREVNTGAYAEIISHTPVKAAEHDLRPGGIYFYRQPRRTYRR